MPEIPVPEESSESKTLISGKVAELSQDEVDPEGKPFKISFADYKENQCEIYGMKKSNAAAALKIIRDIGCYFTDQGSFACKTLNGVEVKHIVGSGCYSVLYNGIDAGADVKEIKYTKIRRNDDANSVDLRIFYYTIDSIRTLYLLAVRQSHYDTSKR
jgi:hypothetical protein